MAITVEDIFFQVTSGLTGGVITDFGTAISAIIFILLILAGLDLLKTLIHSSAAERSSSGHLKHAEWAFLHREASDSGSFEYDYYNSLYRKHLDKTTSHRTSRYKGSDYDI